jgi:hypothetical protein
MGNPRIAWKPGEYCDRCQNTGEIECHCGGDLCICGQGEIECPRCKGLSGRDIGWDPNDDSY